MPRKPRFFVPNGIYHVYCRVARGEFVFDDAIEAEEFVCTVREIRDLDGFMVFAWSLMTNRAFGDPADYANSGHAALIGRHRPRLVEIQATLCGFSTEETGDVADYLTWIRSIAEARWLNAGINKLPWWVEAKHTDEIANPSPQAATGFDCKPAPIYSKPMPLSDFCRRFESVSSHDLADLKSHRRSPQILLGRVEFVMLAVGCGRFRSREVALALCKNVGTISRWHRRGLEQLREDPEFGMRITRLENSISAADALC